MLSLGPSPNWGPHLIGENFSHSACNASTLSKHNWGEDEVRNIKWEQADRRRRASKKVGQRSPFSTIKVREIVGDPALMCVLWRWYFIQCGFNKNHIELLILDDFPLWTEILEMFLCRWEIDPSIVHLEITAVGQSVPSATRLTKIHPPLPEASSAIWCTGDSGPEQSGKVQMGCAIICNWSVYHGL